MKPAHRKYVKEGTGKHRTGPSNTPGNIPTVAKKPRRNVKIVVAEEVGAKGKNVF